MSELHGGEAAAAYRAEADVVVINAAWILRPQPVRPANIHQPRSETLVEVGPRIAAYHLVNDQFQTLMRRQALRQEVALAAATRSPVPLLASPQLPQRPQSDAECLEAHGVPQTLLAGAVHQPTPQQVRDVYQDMEQRMACGCSLFDDDDVLLMKVLPAAAHTAWAPALRCRDPEPPFWGAPGAPASGCARPGLGPQPCAAAHEPGGLGLGGGTGGGS
uniref:Uncharacterized protein n=1 Tax=Haematococcus lacustris TaxID=44745 RepID=A0A699Z180_HAELA